MTTMKKTQSPEKQAYVAPDMSVRQLKMELNFLASDAGANLGDMDPNELFDEGF